MNVKNINNIIPKIHIINIAFKYPILDMIGLFVIIIKTLKNFDIYFFINCILPFPLIPPLADQDGDVIGLQFGFTNRLVFERRF